MHVFLWILQILLALIFAGSGLLKLTQPKQKLAASMAWVEDFPADRVKLIGGLEVLAAIGLILPGWTGILTWLTPLAATGLVILMVLAGQTHRRRQESQALPIVIGLGLVAAFVAIFRFGPFSW
ncbi:MAG: DoxX family membrane protein [Micromonosporaceae bacterium]|nr:DoxX family membrane protein [Micromonosporaceae bacterium]